MFNQINCVEKIVPKIRPILIYFVRSTRIKRNLKIVNIKFTTFSKFFFESKSYYS
jgi:hypothetical protein